MSIINRIRQHQQDYCMPLTATSVLRIWGAYVRNRGKDEPGAYSHVSIEWKLRKYGHGAKEAGRQPDLTSPELACDMAQFTRDIGGWADLILRDYDYPLLVSVYRDHKEPDAAAHKKVGTVRKAIARALQKLAA